MSDRAGFTRLSAPPSGVGGLGELRLPGWHDATVRVLRPFSWDAPERGFRVVDLDVRPERVLVSGPYATATAAALEVGADLDLPGLPDDQAHRYLAHGVPADADAVHQDAAGWFTLAATGPAGEPVALALALDYSGTVATSVRAGAGGLVVRAALPAQTFAPRRPTAPRPAELPPVVVRSGPGGHEDAEAWLRELLLATIPARPAGTGRLAGPLAPPIVADTWGFGTDITPERFAAFVDAAAVLGVEVVTLDKGWETQVGDWTPRPGFADGVAGLAHRVHGRGLAFGLWVAAGNASPESQVVAHHPEWRATWRGGPVIQSHGTWALCLGHAPARDYVLRRLESLVGDGVDWLLHDFETIARCDSVEHDHDPGAGEHAAHEGWYAILAELRRRHPALVVENCWNGGRPLDLRMVAHHDTTIGDDWARSELNRVAKLGLGRFLPSSWCSSYMSDEPELPLTAQLAPYVVGGPWVLMGDLAGWDDDRRAAVERAVAVYRRWRSGEPTARVVAPTTSAQVRGVATTPRADGSVLAAFVVDAARVGAEVRWLPCAGPHPAPLADAVLTDEWTGECRAVTAAELAAGLPLDTSAEAGLVLGLRPA